MPDTAFKPWHRRRMLAILDRATVLVARDSQKPGYIFGYGVFERIAGKFVAHWVYVREHEKRQGIARLMLAAALASLADGATELVATHRTYVDDKAAELGFTSARITDLEPYAELRMASTEKRACG